MSEKGKIEVYLEDLKKDVNITEVTLHEKTLLVPTIKLKWIATLHAEMSYLKKLESADKQLLNNACIKNPNKPRFQHEADLLAEGKLKILRDEIETQNEVVSFLIDCVSTVISQFGYEVSACVKLTQIENS